MIDVSQKIFQNHKNHLIRRLITRSPLIRFGITPKRVDINEIFTNINPNLPTIHGEKRNLTVSAAEFIKKLLDETCEEIIIEKPNIECLSKINKIYNDAKEISQTTGLKSLHIGYPLIKSYSENGTNILAPMYFWRIDFLEKNQRKLKIKIEREEDEISYVENQILKEWIKFEKKIEIQFRNDEELIFQEHIKKILEPWQQLDKNYDINYLDIIPKSLAKDKTKKESKILNGAIIGNVTFKGQALLNDLEKLEEKIKDGKIPNLLKYYLSSRENITEDNENLDKIQDYSHVIDIDHSQEEVIKISNEFKILLIEGPPGTGKSQTIINLISNARSKNKKILVVCQKKAALDILAKRLEAINLKDDYILIDDPKGNRLRIIRELNSIQYGINDSQNFINKNSIKEKILDQETKHNNLRNAVNRNHEKYKFSDLNCKIENLKERIFPRFGKNFDNYILNIDKEDYPESELEFKEKIDSIKKVIQLIKDVSYFENNWKDFDINQSINEDLFNIKRILLEMYEISSELITTSENLHPSYNDWIYKSKIQIPLDYIPLTARKKTAIIKYKRLNQLMERKDRFFFKNINGYVCARKFYELGKYVNDLLKNINSIQKIQSIKEYRKFNYINQFFLNMKGDYNTWDLVYEYIIYNTWYEELTSKHKELREPSSNFFSPNKLFENYNELLLFNIKNIKIDSSQRVNNKIILKDNNLLRERKTRYSPKTSIRMLYDNGFDAITNIKPILFTNPDVASEILPLKEELFDIIIIDEASQMFTSDAFPLLYRAKSVVISGDPMQMPPSDFFMNISDESDDDFDTAEDNKKEFLNKLIPADGVFSLLDATDNALSEKSKFRKRLLVHYRSEHEELIRFSNHAFYDGKLIFPNSNLPAISNFGKPIQVIQLSNSDSDESVIANESAQVVNLLSNLWQENDSISYGVITLNISHKEKILELIEERCSLDDNFKKSYSNQLVLKDKNDENTNFFVRSVEHVQGDERDVIIFATTYTGKTRNFGAITRKFKGRKRLNVAITRAKKAILVVTSLNINHISNDSQKDKSENYYLWKYLVYCEALSKGNITIAGDVIKSISSITNPISTNHMPDSEFELMVGNFLRKNDYSIEYQVGESGFRIDIGVKINSESNLFLCGIECDGKLYHSSWSARLNDVWRQKILESKGWKIYRIWSTDWFNDREQSEKKLLKALSDFRSMRSHLLN